MDDGGPGLAVPVTDQGSGAGDADRPDVVAGDRRDAGHVRVRSAAFVAIGRVGWASREADLEGPVDAVPTADRGAGPVREDALSVAHRPEVVSRDSRDSGELLGA